MLAQVCQEILVSYGGLYMRLKWGCHSFDAKAHGEKTDCIHQIINETMFSFNLIHKHL